MGGNGTILTSTDGATWNNYSFGTTNILRAAADGRGSFVAVGQNGTILTSSDGVSWIMRTSGVSVELYGITFGIDTFVTVGDSGTILQSDSLPMPTRGILLDFKTFDESSDGSSTRHIY